MIHCELRSGWGAPGGSANGVPDAAKTAEDVRKGGAGATEEPAGGETDGEGLAEPRLGVELGLEDDEAGVGVVELAEGVGHEAILPAAAGGEGGVEEGLEVADGLEGGLPGAQALGLVVGEDLLRPRRSLLCVGALVTAGGGGVRGRRLLHSRCKGARCRVLVTAMG